jgi:hypothetical protein
MVRHLVVRCLVRSPLALVMLFSLAAHKTGQAQVVGVSAEEASLRIRYEKGARVVLFYSATCPASREMFPSFVSLARRYAAVGVSILAYSVDDDPELIDYYLGSDVLPFERAYILPAERGALRRALEAEGIRVPAAAYTPAIAVIGPDNRMVGQHAGTRGTRLAEGWLRGLGFSSE